MFKADVPRQVGSLGKRIDTFKPMLGNVVAGFIISALLMVAGMAALFFPLRAAYQADWVIPFTAEIGISWLVVGLTSFLGVAALIGGFALTRYSYGLAFRRVEIWSEGIQHRSRSVTDVVAWSDIQQIVETTRYVRPPIVSGPANLLVPKLSSKEYTIMLASGKHFEFDADSIKSLNRFGKVLREHAQRARIVWKMVTVHD